MLVPSVHEIGARVMVYPEGRPPYEAIVRGYVGDGRAGALNRHAEWYWFTTSTNSEDGAPAERVKRIVRVTLPGGETFEGVPTGTVTDLEGNVAGPMSGYTVSYLHEPNIAVWADPAWVQLL